MDAEAEAPVVPAAAAEIQMDATAEGGNTEAAGEAVQRLEKFELPGSPGLPSAPASSSRRDADRSLLDRRFGSCPTRRRHPPPPPAAALPAAS